MKETDVLILIPARYASSRFPGKPLAKMAGKTMIEYVYKNALAASLESPASNLEFHTAVVTDDDKIEQAVRKFSGNVLRVNDSVRTGTDRVALAFERHFQQRNFQLVINLQGDEPLLCGKTLFRLAQKHLAASDPVFTLVKERSDQEGFVDNGHTKVVIGKERCLYFSRSPIPFQAKKWHLHVGVFSWRPQALLEFVQIPPSCYERWEDLEPLRALEAGMSIGAMEIQEDVCSVNFPEDIPKVERLLDDE